MWFISQRVPLIYESSTTKSLAYLLWNYQPQVLPQSQQELHVDFVKASY
jgi:hypothetical protein